MMTWVWTVMTWVGRSQSWRKQARRFPKHPVMPHSTSYEHVLYGPKEQRCLRSSPPRIDSVGAPSAHAWTRPPSPHNNTPELRYKPIAFFSKQLTGSTGR